jgi:regulator of sirC expression with transglutaminase-like and TPR domain
MTEIDHTTFKAEVAEVGNRLSPLRAGLLFARECAYPDLRPSDYLLQIEDLAGSAACAIAAHPAGLTRGLALAEYLFEATGFRGNSDDYSDPRNSYLNQVLDRRLGIPISLSVLFLELCRRLKVKADGVALPGHFIVAVEGEDGPVYLDPFHGGRVLSQADCVELVRASAGIQGVFDMGWLTAAAPRLIVQRMLGNLRGFYVSVEDWPLAIKVVHHMQSMQPHVSAHLRDMAVLYYRAGSFRKASELLNEYLVREPMAADVASVRQGRDRLLEEMARLN